MLIIHYRLTINKLRACVDPISFWNLSLEHGFLPSLLCYIPPSQ